MPFEHICKNCQTNFVSPKRTAKYCGSKCFGFSQVDKLVFRNKERRKYPTIEGMTRYQVWYRNSNKIDRLRDVKKRQDLLIALGGKCVYCNYDKDLRGLVLDHINGDGNQDRSRLGNKTFRHYINNINEAKQKLQVLCATCNQIKSIENNEHNKTRRIL